VHPPADSFEVNDIADRYDVANLMEIVKHIQKKELPDEYINPRTLLFDGETMISVSFLPCFILKYVTYFALM
jgi:hypothetical protein